MAPSICAKVALAPHHFLSMIEINIPTSAMAQI
jgi:hypothetical protein